MFTLAEGFDDKGEVEEAEEEYVEFLEAREDSAEALECSVGSYLNDQRVFFEEVSSTPVVIVRPEQS